MQSIVIQDFCSLSSIKSSYKVMAAISCVMQYILIVYLLYSNTLCVLITYP